jgi:hypothetical protein
MKRSKRKKWNTQRHFGTIVDSRTGEHRTGFHKVIDPMPTDAKTAEEFLDRFFANLIELYRIMAPQDADGAHRYVVTHLKRLQKSADASGTPAPEDEQVEFQQRLFAGFQKRLKEAEEQDDQNGKQSL